MPVYYSRAKVLLSFVLANAKGHTSGPVLPPRYELGVEEPMLVAGGGGLAPAGGGGGSSLAFGESLQAVPVVPRKLRVVRNSYWEADKCEVEIDYRVFPFDPRAARAIHVSAFIGDLGEPGELVPSVGSLMFTGHADEGNWNIRGDNTIKIEARDNTSLLIDLPWGGAQVSLTEPITDVVQSILSMSESTAGMRVEYRGEGSPPVPAEMQTDTSGGVMSADTKETAWTVINSLVAMVGMVVWVEDNRVVIAPSQVVEVGMAAPAFVYGRNLKRLTVKRAVGFEESPVVQVVSWDPESRAIVGGQWPKESGESKTGTGQTKPSKAVRYVVNHVFDPAALEVIAKRIYERRQQLDIELEFETQEMLGMEREDLLQLRAGMPVRIYFGEEERQYLHGRPKAERVDYLLGLGYAPQVAHAVAETYEQIGDALYQVQEAEHIHDNRKGYQLKATVVNYLQTGGGEEMQEDIERTREANEATGNPEWWEDIDTPKLPARLPVNIDDTVTSPTLTGGGS